jgi:hypothetical protein
MKLTTPQKLGRFADLQSLTSVISIGLNTFNDNGAKILNGHKGQG